MPPVSHMDSRQPEAGKGMGIFEMSNYRVGATRLEPAKDEYMAMQERILEEGVVCTVQCSPTTVSIKITPGPSAGRDWYLAKAAVKGMAGSREIVKA